MIELDVSADIEDAKKQLKRYEREAIPKAVSSSLNKTAANMQTAVNRFMAKRTGLKIKEIKAIQFRVRSTPHTQFAMFITRRRPYNLRRFVRANRLAVGSFRKELGVKANPWKQSRTFRGSFIIRGRTHGKLIVVRRTSRNRQPLRGLYGPSAYIEIQRPEAQALLRRTALERFRINFDRDLQYYISRLP